MKLPKALKEFISNHIRVPKKTSALRGEVQLNGTQYRCAHCKTSFYVASTEEFPPKCPVCGCVIVMVLKQK